MKVYALVGESGSGKSYRAIWIAGRYKLKFVIDDGLLINNGKVIAGKSAKKEKTKMGSTKRAIFFDDKDALLMKKAIEKNKVESLLILGTSNRMVDVIAQRVGVGPVQKYINIRDIASEEEIETAKRIRKTMGMHVIPVPTMAIKKDFQGYFVEKLEILIAKSKYKSEKTVMRPTYSCLGDYSVDRNVLAQICRYETTKAETVLVEEIKVVSGLTGLNINMSIKVKGIKNINKVCENIKKAVRFGLEEYAGVIVDKITIYILDIEA